MSLIFQSRHSGAGIDVDDDVHAERKDDHAVDERKDGHAVDVDDAVVEDNVHTVDGEEIVVNVSRELFGKTSCFGLKEMELFEVIVGQTRRSPLS